VWQYLLFILLITGVSIENKWDLALQTISHITVCVICGFLWQFINLMTQWMGVMNYFNPEKIVTGFSFFPSLPYPSVILFYFRGIIMPSPRSIKTKHIGLAAWKFTSA
jgi:hypothetical protein